MERFYIRLSQRALQPDSGSPLGYVHHDFHVARGDLILTGTGQNQVGGRRYRSIAVTEDDGLRVELVRTRPVAGYANALRLMIEYMHSQGLLLLQEPIFVSVGNSIGWDHTDTCQQCANPSTVAVVLNSRRFFQRTRDRTTVSADFVLNYLNPRDGLLYAWSGLNLDLLSLRRFRRSGRLRLVRRRGWRLITQAAELWGEEGVTRRVGIIHGHSYRPRLRFRGGLEAGTNPTAYFGVELEVDSSERDHYNAPPSSSTIAEVAQEHFGSFLYTKEDGSLTYGAEIVSHPATLPWWTEHRDKVSSMLAALRQLGWQSHSAGTCGMHIHVSRNAFRDEKHLYRFVHLIYRCPALTLYISQRVRRSLEQWANLSQNDRQAMKGKAGISGGRRSVRGRYEAVNMTSHTAELRIFRGTLLVSRFYKNLQFAHAAFIFTAETTRLRHVTARNFVSWVRERQEQYPDLVAYLKNIPDNLLETISGRRRYFSTPPSPASWNQELHCDCSVCSGRRREGAHVRVFVNHDENASQETIQALDQAAEALAAARRGGVERGSNNDDDDVF